MVIDDLEVRLALHHQSQDAGHTGRGLLLVSFPPHSCWMEECKASRCRLERVCVHSKVHGKVRRA